MPAKPGKRKVISIMAAPGGDVNCHDLMAGLELEFGLLSASDGEAGMCSLGFFSSSFLL